MKEMFLLTELKIFALNNTYPFYESVYGDDTYNRGPTFVQQALGMHLGG
jgi:hypothetical protein